MKYYRPNSQNFMGEFFSGPLYLVEIDEKGCYRFVYEDGSATKWSEKKNKSFAKYVEKKQWIEVKEFPTTPWRLEKIKH